MDWLNTVLTLISLLTFWIAGYDTNDFAMEFSLINRSWKLNIKQFLVVIPIILQVLWEFYG